MECETSQRLQIIKNRIVINRLNYNNILLHDSLKDAIKLNLNLKKFKYFEEKIQIPIHTLQKISIRESKLINDKLDICYAKRLESANTLVSSEKLKNSNFDNFIKDLPIKIPVMANEKNSIIKIEDNYDFILKDNKQNYQPENLIEKKKSINDIEGNFNIEKNLSLFY